MQLFQDTHKALRHCVAIMANDVDGVEPTDIISAETQLTFKDAAGTEEDVNDVRIKVKKKAGKKPPNWKEISGHAEDFCGEVLSYAVNPVVEGKPLYEEGHEPITVEGGDGIISIVGPAGEFMGRKLAGIVEQINHIEKLMFKDWVKTDHPTIVEKKFDSEEEASRTMHLLYTMALAFGIKEKTIENSFHEPEDDLTIRIDKRFLKTLIQREQTLESSIEL